MTIIIIIIIVNVFFLAEKKKIKNKKKFKNLRSPNEKIIISAQLLFNVLIKIK